MADNISITEGSGPNKVLTDEIPDGSGVHAQVVKLALGGPGIATQIQAGPQTPALSVPVVGATSAHDIIVTGTRPNNLTPYTAKQVVGQTANGLLTFAGVGIGGGSVLISGAHLEIDTGALPSGMGNFRLALYNAAPATPLANQVDFNFATADRGKWLGIFDLGIPVDLGDTLWAEVNNLGKQVKLVTADLYAYLITDGAFTPAEVSTGFKVGLHTIDI